MTKQTYYIITTVCTIVAIVVTLGSINLGINRAATGQDALVWLHTGAFILAVSLVFTVIIARTKIKK